MWTPLACGGKKKLKRTPACSHTRLQCTLHELRYSGGLLRPLLANQRLVDVGNHTAACDGRLDQGIKLLVPTDGQLQMAGSDTLHFQVLASIASQLQDLGSQVLQNGSTVDSSSGPNTPMAGGTVLQVPMDTSHRELQPAVTPHEKSSTNWGNATRNANRQTLANAHNALILNLAKFSMTPNSENPLY